MPDEPKSFWTSIPGMLTGAAALLTAVASLIAILRAGPDPKPVNPDPPHDSRVLTTEQPVAPRPIVNPEPFTTPQGPSPGPAAVYTDGCVINGEPVVITASNLVLSKARNLMQVGVRVPPHPNCRFCLDDAQGGHYCVGPTGQVYSASILVGNCWPCSAGGC